ncbi:MAG: nitroreductase family protein [Desulfobacteraceae bacterium]|nr:nitroreductase family protein [Desulfobacteraceae bacterium]
MDVLQAIRERRSCRRFLPDPIGEETLRQMLEAAAWAPSPLNSQPWEFVVVTNAAKKAEQRSAAEACHQWALKESGWKWLSGYRMDFLTEAPAIIAVVGDPKKTGVDMFQQEGTVAYQHACAAAIQNLMLAGHALGVATLWFTFFDKPAVREILEVSAEKTPLALVCAGKAAEAVADVPRKDVHAKTRYI